MLYDKNRRGVIKTPLFLIVGSYVLLLLSLNIAHSRGVFVLYTGNVKPFDVATIALGAATVVLTGVGVIVAIAAVWGYNEIRSKSIETAHKTATEVAEKVAKDTAEVVAARTLADWMKAHETNEEKEETNEMVDEAVGNPKNK